MSEDNPDASTADAGQSDAPPSVDCSASNIPIENLKTCYTRAFCRIGTDCQSVFAPTDDCESLLYLYYRSLGIDIEYLIDQFAAQVAAGVVSYDGEALAECLNGGTSGDVCDTSPVACNRVITGLLNEGDPCVSSNECGAGGFCEDQTERCDPGTCRNPVGLGQTCGGNIFCERGTVCSTNPQTGEQRCTSGDLGQTCQNDGDCDQDLFCDDLGSGLCAARRVDGQVCNDDQECAEPLDCIAGSCQRPDADGDRCTFSCIGPFFCEQGGGGNQGTCRPLPVLDGDCSVSNRCLGANLYCDGQTCLTRAALGEFCDNDSVECALGTYCDLGSNECAAPKADGLGCGGDNRECDSFVCDGNAPNLTCEARDLCY